MKSYYPKASQVIKKWHLVDAQNAVLGRLASQVAIVLRGKHKPTYTPAVDDGDFVIIINAEQVHLTGGKGQRERYFWHTGFPGGIKSVLKGKVLQGRFPERVITKAVRNMLPRGPLGRQQLRSLKVYAGSEHPHQAQQPQVFDLVGRNVKNQRRS